MEARAELDVVFRYFSPFLCELIRLMCCGRSGLIFRSRWDAGKVVGKTTRRSELLRDKRDSNIDRCFKQSEALPSGQQAGEYDDGAGDVDRVEIRSARPVVTAGSTKCIGRKEVPFSEIESPHGD